MVKSIYQKILQNAPFPLKPAKNKKLQPNTIIMGDVKWILSQ